MYNNNNIERLRVQAKAGKGKMDATKQLLETHPLLRVTYLIVSRLNALVGVRDGEVERLRVEAEAAKGRMEAAEKLLATKVG